MIRKPPAAISRQLRQETGFGCAECGCPILEYHHIIPWAERNHFEPEHMVALCPSHHTELAKLPRRKCYELKKEPYNIKAGRLRGYLGGNKNQKAIRIGSILIEDCKTALDYCGNSIFSYQQVGGEFRLDTFIPNDNFFPEIEIQQNNVDVYLQEFWDIEFKTNWIKFRKRAGSIFLTIDFRGDEVEVEGQLNILGDEMTLKKHSSQVGGNTFGSVHASHCKVGVSLGPDGILRRPNYAMKFPRPVFEPKLLKH